MAVVVGGLVVVMVTIGPGVVPDVTKGVNVWTIPIKDRVRDENVFLI